MRFGSGSKGDNCPYGKVTVKFLAEDIPDPETFVAPTLNASAIVPNDAIYTAYALINQGMFQRYLVEGPAKKEVFNSFMLTLFRGGPPDPTSVVIQKVDALTRENIPGSLIRLQGISSHQITTEDGQIWEIDNTGINLSQVLTAGAQTGGDRFPARSRDSGGGGSGRFRQRPGAFAGYSANHRGHARRDDLRYRL
jgi:hypothetical protein